jgi:hypothetical protein
LDGVVTVRGDRRAPRIGERAAERARTRGPFGATIAEVCSDGIDQLTQTLVDPDLWLVERSGGEATLLVEGAYAPAWSR